LDHEGGDGAVEGGGGVEVGGAEGEEVLGGGEGLVLEACGQEREKRSGREEGRCCAYFGGFGDAVAEDLDFEVTDGGVEGDGHGRRALPSSVAAHNAFDGNGP